ncbi:UNVERIFIED_CONTAM: hypothetical protein GTU68_039068, partial [Idotea baltica]|nr:hypothetical protein [Idotea baltica]
SIEAGCDEVGRGCLAGPVYAAAVILPKVFPYKKLNDSKKLTKKQRLELETLIKSEAISWSIGICSHLEIDRYNILRASIRAMHKAIKKLDILPQHILVDGNRFDRYKDISHTCIVKGDQLYGSIAAASIIAKTARDRYMERLHKKFPIYGWDQNKGYPTAHHRLSIIDHGICKHHRLSFKLYPELNT